MAQVKVTMTEVVTYEVDVDVDEFTELVGLDVPPDEPLLETLRRLKKLTEDDSDGDYGVAGADGLLDLMIEEVEGTPAEARSVSVSEREWSFEFPDLDVVERVANVKAPQYDDDGWEN